jgi:hypothetical protein
VTINSVLFSRRHAFGAVPTGSFRAGNSIQGAATAGTHSLKSVTWSDGAKSIRGHSKTSKNRFVKPALPQGASRYSLFRAFGLVCPPAL